jgi:hypothetical protein
MVRTNEELEKELLRTQMELASLKAPPTLNVIRHDIVDPHPDTIQMVFEWQQYRHRTMVSRLAYGEGEYREHLFRAGVEACVRAHAEAMLSSLVVTDESYAEHYRRMRA